MRKLRGSRSHGWGQSAGHRGAGSRGGVGKTGGHKHRWTYIVKKEPDYFKKHGFYRKSASITSINVGKLDELASDLLLRGQTTKKDGGEIFIDLEALGVDKLLGSGKVKKQLIIRVRSHSSAADIKIRKEKGQILNVE